MNVLVNLQSVTYTYPNRRVPALSDASLRIENRQLMLITGPSGSGKSTALRTINGLIPHFSGGLINGEISVGGMNVIEVGPEVMSRHVGFVSQNPEAQSLLDRVEPEIAFALENAAVPRAEMHRRVNEVLDILDLTPLRDRLLSTLSGGERQRVAIASALALKPKILVLDEPTSQLDPNSADEVLRSLVALNQELGLTIVLAEHRLERVLPYANAMIYFDNGRVIQQDSVRRVLPRLQQPPPIIELATELNWEPLPLTMTEAREHAQNYVHQLPQVQKADSLHAESDARPLLRVSDLGFGYTSEKRVLDGVDFRVSSGEILAILGPNGSGKSTLLKCIVGLLKPNQGDVHFHGRSILGHETVELAKEIAYLPQYPDDLLFADTVAKELEITLNNHDMPSDDRIAAMLLDLDLLEEAQTYPRDLSTGQRQRVALGAITITQPEVLLLDEPTRGLDGELKRQLAAKWKNWSSKGTAIVLVTHDVELSAQLADNVLILGEGRVQAYGPARKVLAGDSIFAPQIARLFPGSGWLTASDGLNGLRTLKNE